jgi:hypothetical protein
MSLHNRYRWIFHAVLAALTGCSSGQVHPAMPGPSNGTALGPSSVLLTSPNEDESLLGRVLVAYPAEGRSLADVTRISDCLDKLPPKADEVVDTLYENGERLASSDAANNALATFGFAPDRGAATLFYYNVKADRRIVQRRSDEYEACCKEKGTCGLGFVSALVHGMGRYVTASQRSDERGKDMAPPIPLAGGDDGFVSVQMLHARSVQGYFAAEVAANAAQQRVGISSLGDPAALDNPPREDSLPESEKRQFALEKIEIVDGEGDANSYTLKNGSGAIAESEFARRYRDMTGAADLDAPSGVRPGIWLIATGAVVVAASVGAAAILALQSDTCTPGSYCSYHTSDSTTLTASILGSGSALGGAFIGAGVASNNSPAVTRADAETYVARYNRALLREIAHEAQAPLRTPNPDTGRASRSVLRPALLPTWAGLVGQF